MSLDAFPNPVECFVQAGSHRIPVFDGRGGRSGPPVVYVHGIMLSATLWPLILKGTELDQFPWIALGLPCHFPSESPENLGPADISVDLFADCVLEPVREYFGDTQVHLVGWSTGGFASLAAAAREPARVASVVSLAGFARGKWGSHLGNIQSLAGGWLGRTILKMGMRTVGCSQRLFDLLSQSLAEQKMEVPRDVSRALFDDYRRHDMRTMRMLLARIAELDSSQSLADVKAPVLILQGDADKVITPDEAHHLLEHLPDARLIEIPGMGHMFFGEALEETLSQIHEWIETRWREGNH